MPMSLRCRSVDDRVGLRQELIEQGRVVVGPIIDVELLSRLGVELGVQLGIPEEPPAPVAQRIAASLAAETVSMQEVRAAGYRCAAFHAIARSPQLVETLSEILDDDLWLHPRRFVRLGIPRAPGSWTTEPHQDFRYVQGAVDTLTIWAPLGDVTADEGPLLMRPGSHLSGLLPTLQSDDGALPEVVSAAADSEGWQPVPLNVGSVVIFHSLMVHASQPPFSRARLSLDFRYQRDSEPVCEAEMLAPFETESSDDPAIWALDKRWSPPGGDMVPFQPIESVVLPSRSRLLS